MFGINASMVAEFVSLGVQGSVVFVFRLTGTHTPFAVVYTVRVYTLYTGSREDSVGHHQALLQHAAPGHSSRGHRNTYRSHPARALSQPAPILPSQGADFPGEPDTTAWMAALLRTFAISASEFDAYVSMARYAALPVSSGPVHSWSCPIDFDKLLCCSVVKLACHWHSWAQPSSAFLVTSALLVKHV